MSRPLLLSVQLSVEFDYTSPQNETITNSYDALGNVQYPVLTAVAQVAVSYPGSSPQQPQVSPASPPPIAPSKSVGATPSNSRTPSASVTPSPIVADSPVDIYIQMTITPGATSPSHSTYAIVSGANITQTEVLTGVDASTYGASRLVYLSVVTGTTFSIQVTPMDAYGNQQTRTLAVGTVTACV